jgi:hypothetical protein
MVLPRINWYEIIPRRGLRACTEVDAIKMKMVAGALHPGERTYFLSSVMRPNPCTTGKPVSNLYFSMWSHVCLGPQ